MEVVGTMGCVAYIMLQPRRLRVQDMGVRSSQPLDQPAIVPTWPAAVRRHLTQLGNFAGTMEVAATQRATPKWADTAIDFTAFETTCSLAKSQCDARSQCLLCVGTHCSAHQKELKNSRDGWTQTTKTLRADNSAIWSASCSEQPKELMAQMAEIMAWPEQAAFRKELSHYGAVPLTKAEIERAIVDSALGPLYVRIWRTENPSQYWVRVAEDYGNDHYARWYKELGVDGIAPSAAAFNNEKTADLIECCLAMQTITDVGGDLPSILGGSIEVFVDWLVTALDQWVPKDPVSALEDVLSASDPPTKSVAGQQQPDPPTKSEAGQKQEPEQGEDNSSDSEESTENSRKWANRKTKREDEGDAAVERMMKIRRLEVQRVQIEAENVTHSRKVNTHIDKMLDIMQYDRAEGVHHSDSEEEPPDGENKIIKKTRNTQRQRAQAFNSSVGYGGRHGQNRGGSGGLVLGRGQDRSYAAGAKAKRGRQSCGNRKCFGRSGEGRGCWFGKIGCGRKMRQISHHSHPGGNSGRT